MLPLYVSLTSKILDFYNIYSSIHFLAYNEPFIYEPFYFNQIWKRTWAFLTAFCFQKVKFSTQSACTRIHISSLILSHVHTRALQDFCNSSPSHFYRSLVLHAEPIRIHLGWRMWLLPSLVNAKVTPKLTHPYHHRSCLWLNPSPRRQPLMWQYGSPSAPRLRRVTVVTVRLTASVYLHGWLRELCGTWQEYQNRGVKFGWKPTGIQYYFTYTQIEQHVWFWVDVSLLQIPYLYLRGQKKLFVWIIKV